VNSIVSVGDSSNLNPGLLSIFCQRFGAWRWWGIESRNFDLNTDQAKAKI